MNSSTNIQEEEEVKISFGSRVCSFLKEYWFYLSLPIGICLSYLNPSIGKSGGYIRSEWTIKYVCIIIVFFLNGLSIEINQFKKEILNIRLHLFIQIFSLFIIPFTIYSLRFILIKLNLNEMLIIGIVLLGSTSTTISSNVLMTKNAHGNDCGALINAVLGNILSIFISPILIIYFLKDSLLNEESIGKKRINYENVLKELSLIVLIPFLIGQILNLLLKKQIYFIRTKFNFAHLNNLCLLLVIWSVFSTSFANQIFQSVKRKDLFLLILIDLTIYITFSILIFLISRIPIGNWKFCKEDSIAIMFCSTMKSVAMSISLINSFFHQQNEKMIGLILLPSILYHLSQLILSAFFVLILQKWIQNDLTNTNNNQQLIQLNNQNNFIGTK